MVANLDVKVLRFMTADEFRVLIAAEMGMKNHTIVPMPLIASLAALKRGGAYKMIKLLAKNKLVQHHSVPYDGYRLTSKGYDFLALKSFAKRGTLAAMGIQIGVGKESDIFTVVTPEGREVCIKLHRLGRTCFRAVKNNRDYTKPGQNVSWIYLSRLSALKEYAFMKALHAHGFPTPEPIDVNRHCVIMSLAHGYVLNSVQKLRHPAAVFGRLMEIIVRLAEHGLIHGDFNEFNLLVDDEENVTVIDFPQMVSTSHINAEYYFNRDVECVRNFFRRRFGFEAESVPTLAGDVLRAGGGGGGSSSLDEELKASGWTDAYSSDFGRLMDIAEGEEREAEARGETGGAGSDEEENGDDDEEEGKDGIAEEGEGDGAWEESEEEEESEDDEQQRAEGGEEEDDVGLLPAANNRRFRSGIYNKNASAQPVAEAGAEAMPRREGGMSVIGADKPAGGAGLGGSVWGRGGSRAREWDEASSVSGRSGTSWWGTGSKGGSGGGGKDGGAGGGNEADSSPGAKRAAELLAIEREKERQADLESLAELAQLAARTTLTGEKKDEQQQQEGKAVPEVGEGSTAANAPAAAPPLMVDLSDASAAAALPTLPLSATRGGKLIGGGPGSARGPGSVAGSVCSARALEAKERVKAELSRKASAQQKPGRRSVNEGKDREMRKTKMQMKRDVQGGFFS